MSAESPDTVFADASFLIATIWDRDDHRARALALLEELGDVNFVVTDGVINEVVAHAVKRGMGLRRSALGLVRDILDPNGPYTIEYGNEARLRAATDLYERWLRQGPSLVDCTAMVVMDELGLDTALTFDGDFDLPGKYALLPPAPEPD